MKYATTMKLKLDRIKETLVDVPDDAEFVADLELQVTTKKVWDVVFNRYRIYHLRALKVWVKQPDGSFRLEVWPCNQFHEREAVAKPEAPKCDWCGTGFKAHKMKDGRIIFRCQGCSPPTIWVSRADEKLAQEKVEQVIREMRLYQS